MRGIYACEGLFERVNNHQNFSRKIPSSFWLGETGIDPIDPKSPARFNLVIDSPPGSYPIRLVEADRRIGSIVITD